MMRTNYEACLLASLLILAFAKAVEFHDVDTTIPEQSLRSTVAGEDEQQHETPNSVLLAAAREESSSAVLGRKKRSYRDAVQKAVTLRAEYDLAKKNAIDKKLRLDRYRAKREREETVDVHKRAAYIELKRSAAEEKQAKEQRKSANTQKNFFQSKMNEASVLELKARQDKEAALEEIHHAAAARKGQIYHSPLYATDARRPTDRGDAVSKDEARRAARSAVDAVTSARKAAAQARRHPNRVSIQDAKDAEQRAQETISHSEDVVEHRHEGLGLKEHQSGQAIARQVVGEIFKGEGPGEY